MTDRPRGQYIFQRGAAFLEILAFFALGAALLLYPGQVRDAVGGSILYCLTVLIPSLFPFMALTSFAVNSSVGEICGRGLGFLSRRLFCLPGVCALPILMSFIGGYPAGAKGASLLLAQGKITGEQAGRMMLFCVNPGVAFVVTFLGGSVLHSFRAGWLLFFAVTLSGVLLGVLTGLLPFFRNPEDALSSIPEKPKPEERSTNAGALIQSVSDASSSVTAMCACIVLFSGINAMLHGSGIYQALVRLLSRIGPFTSLESAAVVSFLWEVTGGVGDASRFRVGPGFFAFGLAFGGLCVHLQVFSVFSGLPQFPVKKWKFFLFRVFHGLLSSLLWWGLSRFFPQSSAQTAAYFENAGYSFGGTSGTLAGGLSLLLMCAAFLVITSQKAPTRIARAGKK